MVRIKGVDLPDNKRIEIGLTYIFGIGRSLARQILNHSRIKLDTKVKDLTEQEVAKIRDLIDEKYKTEGDLRREISLNIKRLKDVACYRGIRHIKGLPARGQQTKTNSRTVRGNKRRTMGSGKRAVEKK